MFWKKRTGSIIGSLLLAVVCAAFVLRKGDSTAMLIFVAFAAVMCVTAFFSKKTGRIMKHLGVDKSTWQHFEHERNSGEVKCFEQFVITQSYVARQTGKHQELFPLSEIIGLRCGNFYRAKSSRRYDEYYVELLFRSGKSYHLIVGAEDLGELRAKELINLLAQRCPELRSRIEGRQHYSLSELWPIDHKR